MSRYRAYLPGCLGLILLLVVSHCQMADLNMQGFPCDRSEQCGGLSCIQPCPGCQGQCMLASQTEKPAVEATGVDAGQEFDASHDRSTATDQKFDTSHDRNVDAGQKFDVSHDRGIDADQKFDTKAGQEFDGSCDGNVDKDDMCPWLLTVSSPGNIYPAWSIVRDNQGNLYLTGFFTGSINLGQKTLVAKNSGDIFVLKVNPQGQIVWGQSFGSSDKTNSQDERGSALALGPQGSLYVTGGFLGTMQFGPKLTKTSRGDADFFLLKISPQGEVLWVQTGGGTAYDEGRTLVVDDQGHIYVGGRYKQTALFGTKTLVSQASADGFVAKYDDTGRLLWIIPTHAKGWMDTGVYAADTQGNTYLCGAFHYDAQFGSISVNNPHNTTIWVSYIAKLNSKGEFLWVQRLAGTDSVMCRSLVRTPSGELYVGGDFQGEADFFGQKIRSASPTTDDIFVMKLDATGKRLWLQTFGSRLTDGLRALHLDKQGDLYATGSFTDQMQIGKTLLKSQGNIDAWIARFNPQGEVVWAHSVGGIEPVSGNAVITGDTGILYLMGAFRGEAHFANQQRQSAGEADLYLWKIQTPR